jgi:hypothetical protein
MVISRLIKSLVSHKKCKKRVIILPETYYKDYALCESAYKALTIVAEIEKKPGSDGNMVLQRLLQRKCTEENHTIRKKKS